MKYWVVKDESDSTKLAMVGNSHSPKGAICEVSREFYKEEDEAWVETVDVIDESALPGSEEAGSSEPTGQKKAVVNEERKAQVLAERAKAAEPTVDELRRAEYPSTDKLIVALWESVVEGRPEAAQALQVKREEVKAKYPKEPTS